MTDKLDEILSAEGQRWRENLGPDPELTTLLDRSRQRTGPTRATVLAVAALVAAVSIGVSVGAVMITGHRGTADPGRPTVNGGPPVSAGGFEVSCVAPILGVVPNPALSGLGRHASVGTVAPGQAVTVFGQFYFGGPCDDTGQLPHPAVPQSAVPLWLTTADQQTRTLATAHPNRQAGFTATLTVPVDAAPGPATISDNQGNTIELVIMRSTGASTDELSAAQRTLALAAAHDEASRSAIGRENGSGFDWPSGIRIVTASVGAGTVSDSNTGYPCDSGRLIAVRLIGDFDTVTTGHPVLPGSSGSADFSVHAVDLTVDASSGVTCLISVRTGTVEPDPGATVLYTR